MYCVIRGRAGMQSYDFVVIGGGIVGLSVALGNNAAQPWRPSRRS
jgi:glycerol-3-phosphate dehydrogenase